MYKVPRELPRSISIRSLERSLQAWNFFKRHQTCQNLNDGQLIQRLWVLFYDMGLTDRKMLGFLVQEGYTISLRM